MHFESPWLLLLLALVPPVIWLGKRRGTRGRIRVPSVEIAERAGRSLRTRLTWAPVLLRTCVLVLLVGAMAGPRQHRARVPEYSRGIAIEVVVDRSGSMSNTMAYAGEEMTRLEVAKAVFERFVAGDGEALQGRSSDLVGMVAFAGNADTMCPLTLEHGVVVDLLRNIALAEPGPQDGTAIGDGIARAAARLKTVDETLAGQRGAGSKQYEIKSKVIILLTDGLNNAGERSPLQAAALAKKWGVKIYAIGIGPEYKTEQAGYGVIRRPVIDRAALEQVAVMTGGACHMAGDSEALLSVYEEIDTMEKSAVQAFRYAGTRDMALPLVLVAAMLLVVETALKCTVLRRLP
jgi:Ca-activated chloride channel family protein